MLSEAERARRYRDKIRGGPPRGLLPCGTPAAYERHRRAGEPIDELCRVANNKYRRAARKLRLAGNKP